MEYYLMALKKYVDFEGRARRAEFWYFVLIHFLVMLAIGILSGIARIPELVWIYFLATILPYIALCIRRMHDVDKSGWYSLIPVYSIILLFEDGTAGDNRFGADPKGRGASSFTPSPSTYTNSTATSDTDAIERIEKLSKLRDQGIITEEEFRAKKKQLLGL